MSKNTFFHVALNSSREGITTKGLLASTRTKGIPFHGVWVTHPQTNFQGIGMHLSGTDTDIWELNHDEKDTVRDPDNGHVVIPHDVPVSDIKRVGHFWQNPKTYGREVHWHKEEDCNGQSIHES